MGTDRHLYLHSEDLDGWLTEGNQPLGAVCVRALRRLQGLRVEADGETHELQIVLNSGKAPAYLEDQARLFGGRSVISCNGAIWKEAGREAQPFVQPSPDFARLRERLGLDPHEADVVTLRAEGLQAQLAIEAGKQIGGRDVIISFFPEWEPVAHRWSFTQGTDRRELHGFLQGLIAKHGFDLELLEPHGDGAVDVVPRVEGRRLGKWTLPALARRMDERATLHLTHGGDGANDREAMATEGVLPLSSVSCPDTRDIVRERGGIVAQRSAPCAAVFECYGELARREWYGPLSTEVARIAEAALGELDCKA